MTMLQRCFSHHVYELLTAAQERWADSFLEVGDFSMIPAQVLDCGRDIIEESVGIIVLMLRLLQFKLTNPCFPLILQFHNLGHRTPMCQHPENEAVSVGLRHYSCAIIATAPMNSIHQTKTVPSHFQEQGDTVQLVGGREARMLSFCWKTVDFWAERTNMSEQNN